MAEEQHEAKGYFVAHDAMDILQDKSVFYYPDLLERPYDYMFLATDIRWRLEYLIYEAEESSKVVPILRTMQDICEDFQADIYYCTPLGSDISTLPEEKLRELVGVFRRQMSRPVAELVRDYRIFIGQNFKATMLGAES